MRIDSRILGIDRRSRVSWMERQSSFEISTALERLQVIWIGSCVVAVWSRSLNRLALARLAVSVVIRNLHSGTYVM